MTDFSWRIDDEDGDPELTGAPQPLVVTWRIVRDALRRSWRWCVGAVLLGGLVGMLALGALPHPASATTTLLLVHPNADDPSAMSTDVSLLMTRAVATDVITRLRLPSTTPDSLHGSMTAQPLTQQLLQLTVTAPDDAAAVTRSTAIVDTFLAFRGRQLRSISEGIVSGYQKRISDLQARVDTLTKDYEGLRGSSSADQVAASDILSQRAQLGSQISSMQQAIEDARLQTEAAVTATHVIDAPYANSRASRRAVVLYGASGALLLGSLTVGVVLFRALTSDRLRRRRDIADALGVPVRVGVGSLRAPGPVARTGRWLRTQLAHLLSGLSRGRHGRAPRNRAERDLEALVRGLDSALPAQAPRRSDPGRKPHEGRRRVRPATGPTTLALAAIDDTETATRVLVAVADRRAQQGCRVVLVDLTERGSLAAAARHPQGVPVAEAAPRAGAGDVVRHPVTLRPPGDAPLSRGPRKPARRHSAPPDPLDDLLRAEWDDADIALVLVEMDPGLDIDTFTTWTSRIVPLVSAGRASRELLRTVAGMVASARLDMPFALVEGVDRSDETSGAAEPLRTESTTPLAELPVTAPSAAVARPVAHPPARYHTGARDLPGLVLYAWAALFLNVLAPSSGETLVPLPHAVLQVIAQGSLLLAALFAVLANPRLLLRPNLFLVLLSLLAVVSFAVSLHNEFLLGSVYRGCRFVGFVVVLWLLSPWWGRRDLLLLRAHRVCLWVVLVMVLAGAVLAPGKAFSFEGRLSGTVWPVPPTQVAHYAALVFGTSVILWMCRVITGRHALMGVVVGTVALIGTHTRTALLGAAIGLALASGSLFFGHARVRRVSVSTLVGVMAGTLLFAPQIITWLARGQTLSEASRLTGRTEVWSDVFAAPRPAVMQFFGSGLSNKSYRGLAIDSNWVATYVDQGWLGMVIEAGLLVLLLLTAVTHVRGPRRALASFLIVYAIVASITETGLGDASPYLLDLVVAASLLATPFEEARR